MPFCCLSSAVWRHALCLLLCTGPRVLGDYAIPHLELSPQPPLFLTLLGGHESLDSLLFTAKRDFSKLRIAFEYEYKY